VTKVPEAKDGGNIVKFKYFKRQLDVPIVVYADFECVLEKLHYDELGNERTLEQSVLDKKHYDNSDNVRTIQVHKPVAYSYFVKCNFDDSLNIMRKHVKSENGEDIGEHFVQSLFDDCMPLMKDHVLVVKPMNPLTDEEEDDLCNTTNCHICKKPLLQDRVADHCHLTGKFRGPAHSKCNLEFQLSHFVPIFFHNFSAYDCHLFVKSLATIQGKTEVIASTSEKYTCLSKRIFIDEKRSVQFRFLDSYKFLSESLEKLAKYLPKENFHLLSSVFKSPEEQNLLTRKGVFPYDYLDCMERLSDTELPPIEHFFNKLTNEKCAEQDYIHAKKVWSFFNCQNLKDYMMIYLMTDVLLLADIMENFRSVTKRIYGLDPCQYITLPAFSWDAMLKHTKAELELLTDIEMIYFIKNAIRGGLVQCSKRHSVANNKYLRTSNQTKKKSTIVYLDANNLYGWAMSEYLPYAGFDWVQNVENFDIFSISETSDIGYILEVDLEYPMEIHDEHNDLPFCTETKKMHKNKTKKLYANLDGKTKYVIHYRNLQQCLRHGLKLKKIHRILEFNQSPWLKKYIDLNTELRKQAKNDFEKNLFKLLNNCIYGKTIENVEKRKNIKLVDRWEDEGNFHCARALVAKPNLQDVIYFTDSLAALVLKTEQICYNKPIYVGFTVLELSKLKMYDFHYAYMLPKFGKRLALNYMDTDSFIYTIETNDFYNEILPDIAEKFDTSDYPIDNQFNIPLKNKKVLGMMKDELKGKIIEEFIGLRSKMYSIKIQDDKDIKKSKGVRTCIVKELSMDDYRLCLLKDVTFRRDMCVFRSDMHEIYTQTWNKVVLSNNDDKRFIKDNKIDTYAWGHYQITLDLLEYLENCNE